VQFGARICVVNPPPYTSRRWVATASVWNISPRLKNLNLDGIYPTDATELQSQQKADSQPAPLVVD